MKKLYRIHSRYILEINDELEADMSGQLVELNFDKKRNNIKIRAKPLGEDRLQKKRKIDVNSEITSLFLNKNNITDYEEMLEKG
jgi:hypothetical protein